MKFEACDLAQFGAYLVTDYRGDIEMLMFRFLIARLLWSMVMADYWLHCKHGEFANFIQCSTFVLAKIVAWIAGAVALYNAQVANEILETITFVILAVALVWSGVKLANVGEKPNQKKWSPFVVYFIITLRVSLACGLTVFLIFFSFINSISESNTEGLSRVFLPYLCFVPVLYLTIFRETDTVTSG